MEKNKLGEEVLYNKRYLGGEPEQEWCHINKDGEKGDKDVGFRVIIRNEVGETPTCS